MNRIAGSLALLAMFLGGCTSIPVVSTLPFDVAMTKEPVYDAETTAVAIPPGGKCGDGSTLANGRIVVASGGATQGGGPAQRVLYRDLNGGGDTTVLPLADTSFFPLKDGNFFGADNVLLRLHNRDLLLIWNGVTWKEMTGPDGKHPAWWDTTSDHPGSRGAFHIWRSSDCGSSWNYDTAIDSAQVKVAEKGLDASGDIGRCAWPQGNPDNNGKYSYSGWDREDAYVDPFDGKVYISTNCNSGSAVSVSHDFVCTFDHHKVLLCNIVDSQSPLFPGHDYSQSVVLTADENGKTWSESALNLLRRSAPIAMTSTQAGKLFLHQCTGDQPNLSRRLPAPDDAAFASVVASSLVTGTDLRDCWAMPDDGRQPKEIDPKKKWPTFLVGNPWVLAENRTMSRVYFDPKSGVQIVRIAYPAIENYQEAADGTFIGGRQVWMVTVVVVNSDGTMAPATTYPIRAKDSKGSVLQATFVETDRTELNSGSDEDAALLYWIEEAPDNIPGGKLIARGRVVRGAGAWSDLIDLSSPWTPAFIANGWRGDYLHGAYYFAGGKSHFLAQWPQTDETLVSGGKVTPNLNIHYNVVTVDPAPAQIDSRVTANPVPPVRWPADLRIPKPGEINERLELERRRDARVQAHTHPPASTSSVVTAPQASASEFFFGDGRCGGSQSTIYAGVVPEDASRVELHYLLRDASGQETSAEVVRPMSRPGRDRHVYAQTIHANNDDLPGYGRFAEGRLLYYVVVTDSRGVTTRGETYGEQKGSEIRVARCGR